MSTKIMPTKMKIYEFSCQLKHKKFAHEKFNTLTVFRLFGREKFAKWPNNGKWILKILSIEGENIGNFPSIFHHTVFVVFWFIEFSKCTGYCNGLLGSANRLL